jgi:nitroreductase
MAMTSSIYDEDNRVLDRIIRSRRTVRQFKPDGLPRTMVEEIIQAGLLAPYARAAVTREDFRKFLVIPRESEVTERVASLIQRRATAMFENLRTEMHQDEYVRSHGGPWLERLKRLSEQGPPNLGKAPYYIVVAEQRGIPAIEEASLAHCLENMWLKATAMGLGFQILSITEQMTEDQEFCELIGISGEEFSLNGCIIGYADVDPPPTQRPRLEEAIRWL